MIKIKRTVSGFKENVKNKARNLKKKTEINLQKFKEDFSQAKNRPISKRKSLFLGFTTVVSIFGITLLTPVLGAVAQELPKNGPNPSQVSPQPVKGSPIITSDALIKGLSTAAGTVCTLAVVSGPYIVGVVCGVVVVAGILKATGK